MTPSLAPTRHVQVFEVSADRAPAYEDFVASHPAALVSYSLRYRDCLVEVLGCKPVYAIAMLGDRVVGVLPVMSTHGQFGEVLNSLPYFGSNGGPLVTSEEACEALMRWYDRRARENGVATATVVSNPMAVACRPPTHELTGERVAHVTNLPPADCAREEVWRGIEGSARRNIKKAKRLGTVVAVENDAFPELEALHQAAMRAIGAPVKSHGFFEAAERHFRPGVDFDIFIARLAGEPVAGLLVFYSGCTVDYYVPAVGPEHRPFQAMAAILFTALVRAAERGLTRWNWGGSWPDHLGLQRFKAKWGGRPHSYRYWTAVNDRGALDVPPDVVRAAYPGFFVVPFTN